MTGQKATQRPPAIPAWAAQFVGRRIDPDRATAAGWREVEPGKWSVTFHSPCNALRWVEVRVTFSRRGLTRIRTPVTRQLFNPPTVRMLAPKALPLLPAELAEALRTLEELLPG